VKIISLNVSRPRQVPYRGKLIRTGIFKEPVDGPRMLRALNVEGDGQADLEAHGGVHKAAYAYTIEHYVYWARELDRDDFQWGQFGENFTVERMPEEEIHIGDRFRMGEALVEVTQPRVPCAKLGLRMDMATFPKLLLASGRTGFYMRVIEEGRVCADDTIERVRIDPERMSVREVNHLLYFDRQNLEEIQRALRIPALSPGWRGSFEEIVWKAMTRGAKPRP
jgi:MOSC domain-containing protein YiiM